MGGSGVPGNVGSKFVQNGSFVIGKPTAWTTLKFRNNHVEELHSFSHYVLPWSEPIIINNCRPSPPTSPAAMPDCQISCPRVVKMEMRQRNMGTLTSPQWQGMAGPRSGWIVPYGSLWFHPKRWGKLWEFAKGQNDVCKAQFEQEPMSRKVVLLLFLCFRPLVWLLSMETCDDGSFNCSCASLLMPTCTQN